MAKLDDRDAYPYGTPTPNSYIPGVDGDGDTVVFRLSDLKDDWAPELFPVNTVAVSVANNRVLITRNTQATAIEEMTDGVEGQRLTIIPDDNFTSIVKDTPFLLPTPSDLKLVKGRFYEFIRFENKWHLLPPSIGWMSGDRGNASVTLTYAIDADTQLFMSPLTLARTVTINNTNVPAGARFRVIRGATCTGAFDITVGSLAVLGVPGEYVDIEHDGTNWMMVAQGFFGGAEARRRTVHRTTAPATGYWRRGDYCRNIDPAVGQPKGWLCTNTGSPGTWVSEGTL